MKLSRLLHDSATHRKARLYKEEFLLGHFGRPRRTKTKRGQAWHSIGAWNTAGSNIIGVGYGLKEAGGAGVASSRALRVYVRRKLPKGNVRKADLIPDLINGLPTDVIAVSSFQASTRPAEGGQSGAHRSAQPGTLGCLTRDRNNGSNYILSCYHVITDEDDPAFEDDVLEPAPADGGVAPIGRLQRWMNLNDSGNVVDCALARMNNSGDFLPEIRYLGRPNPAPLQAAMHQSVKKSGRNYPYVTLGVITDVSADVMVDYRRGPVGFVQQIVIRGVGGVFAEKGDSGSLVVDADTLQPVGLLFAVGNGLGLANPISAVLDDLGVDIA